MKLACEYVSKEILPAVRAIIARKMMSDHSLSQTQVAVLMETTQPAVSQYKRELRGKRVKMIKDDPDVIARIESMTRKIVTGSFSRDDFGREFCSICRLMHSKGVVPQEFLCHAWEK